MIALYWDMLKIKPKKYASLPMSPNEKIETYDDFNL
jgi:hypothetical protein